MSLVLHGYWRSSAAYRVRIALNLKGIAYRHVTHDLRTGEHRSAAYRAIAPLGLVPTLEVDGTPLTQSLAILEWIEERHAQPPLLPNDATKRAIVRSMASIIACDTHPINNLRVLVVLRSEFAASDEAVQAWISRWIGESFTALEQLVDEHGRGFCFGDTPTMADCCLVPQIYNARRFGVDLCGLPSLVAVERRCKALDAFVRASPEVQPDAEGSAA